MEVRSPGNRGRDLLTNRALYERAGVREYWIVDPIERTEEQMDAAGERLISPVLSGSGFLMTDIVAGLAPRD